MKKSNLKSQIKGVVFFDLDHYEDDRGWLVELFRNDFLFPCNYPVMAYVSQTKPGIIRGPHEHEVQSDLFCFIGPGNFELTLWEKSEKTISNRLTDVIYEERHLLGECNPKAVIVPPGVVLSLIHI